MRLERKLNAVDLFCGAGGTTTGAEQSGRVTVTLAVNHWRVAVQTHRENHPGVRHICAEVDQVDPRDFVDQGINVLLASPECIFHSNARGGKPVDDQRRATAWCVPRWAEVLRPKWIICENVREFEQWGPLGVDNRPLKSKAGEIFQAWIGTLRALNYHVEWRLLNAADFGGATKRVRLFVVARRGASRQPIPWPAPTHSRETWTPAYSIIDWSRPCPSIFDRARPLADKTLRRIEIGLRKFCGEAFGYQLIGRGAGRSRDLGEPLPTIVAARENHGIVTPFVVKLRRNADAKSVMEPLDTLTAGAQHFGIAQPFLVPNFGERDGQEPRTHAIDDPLPTVTGHGAGGLVAPFVVAYHAGQKPGNDGLQRQYSLLDPLPTVDTQPRFALAAPFFLPRQGFYDCRKDKQPSSIEDPLPTITANHGPGHVVMPYLVDVNHGDGDRSPCGRVHTVDQPLGAVTTKRGQALCLPFVTEYYGTGDARSVHEPLSTVTTKHRHGLAMVQLVQTMAELRVVDIGFRMLDADELARAQGFPAGYQLFGTKAEQIKQIGNSVHTAVAKALCEAIGDAA